MNLTTLALMTLGLGQVPLTAPTPAAPFASATASAAPAPKGYQALKTRSIKLDLDVDPKQQSKVNHVELFASRDKGGVWESVAQAKPDAKFIPFNAKDDGLYWLSMAIIYKDGTQDPANIASKAPDQKLLIDTTPPTVRIRDAARLGDDISIEWSIDDAFPADDRTKVEFRPGGGSETSWKSVPVTSADRRGTKFNPNSNTPIQVRITVEDQAGNSAAQQTDVAGFNTGTAPALIPGTDSTAMKSLTPPNLVAPSTLPTATPLDPSVTGTIPSGPAPVMDLTPRTAPPQPLAVGGSPAPLATSMAVAPAPVDAVPATVINYVRFDLPYQLEAGPSGISRIDLYVTRDDGATWIKWSEHDGKESPLKVALDRRYNPQPEGTYGFRLVPVSGAGLSDAVPTKGTLPEIRVQVDLTPPIIKIFQPEADANQREILILKWEATDKNFCKDPISLEWSEGPSGPWKPVAGVEGLMPVAAGQGGGGMKVANTGTYGWKLPMNLPTHKLYLKVSAIDAAGNKSEVATPAPILVDLVKPKARIQGIMPTVVK
ncbi:hypothetical protein BH11PLA2_BH11PLA2_01120 [soil metagenome]